MRLLVVEDEANLAAATASEAACDGVTTGEGTSEASGCAVP